MASTNTNPNTEANTEAKPNANTNDISIQASNPVLPRVAITFCTQCKWMLRAAYFAQELLSTFGTVIGEVALIPGTGGVFTVDLTYRGLLPPGESVEESESVEQRQQSQQSQQHEKSEKSNPSATSTTTSTTPKAATNESGLQTVRLWEFKTAKSFPETKVLKQLVRNHLQPGRSLGHSDKGGTRERVIKGEQGERGEEKVVERGQDEQGREKVGEVCEDCK